MMKVSIIVPVYNAENYLDECLKSLIRQTLKDIEIILIDDGSMDNSGIICDAYAEKDQRIKVVHQENRGMSAARNRAMEMAVGEYILFCDDDDYIDVNACEKLYDSAKKYGVDIVHSDLINEKDRVINQGYRKLTQVDEAISNVDFIYRKFVTQTYDMVAFLYFVRREFLIENDISFKEGCYYEDQLWTLQLLTTNSRVLKLQFPYYFYRARRGSTSNTIKLKNGIDVACICNEMAKYIQEKLEGKVKDYAWYILLLSVYQYISVFSALKKSDRYIVEKEIDKDTVDIILFHGKAQYFKQFYRKVMFFFKHKHLYLFMAITKNKIKRYLK